MLSSAFAIATDDMLVARARGGDLDAIESVYRTFEAPVYNLARRLCRNAEDAEDVLQETFMEVMKSIDRFRGDGSFAGWVRKVAASKALMRLRHEKIRETAPLDMEEGPDHSAAASFAGFEADSLRVTPERIDLESALARLGDTARAVVWLHDVEGYTHEEIASMMKKTPSFSKSQLARAHAQLRRWLDPEEQH